MFFFFSIMHRSKVAQRMLIVKSKLRLDDTLIEQECLILPSLDKMGLMT